MKSSELFKFVCQCLQLDEENPELKEGIREKLISQEFDLDRFILLCSNHLVLPVVYRKLNDAGLLDVIPREYKTHLKEIYLLNKKRNREILQQIDQINAPSQIENIQLLYLKGTANLMDALYLDPGDRMIGDIDFLVNEDDYLRTIELIRGLGYKGNVTDYDDLKILKHYPALFKEDVPGDIEIHLLPALKAHTGQFYPELLFQNKKIVENNYNCYVLSDEFKLVHTFIHCQLDHKGYQFKSISLRDLYDTYLLMKKVNISSVKKQIEEKKKAEMFFEYIDLLMSPALARMELNNNNSNKLASCHLWFLDHPKQHRSYITFLKGLDMFIIRPFLKIRNAIFHKSSRISLYRRIKDPKWYKIMYNGIKKTFS